MQPIYHSFLTVPILSLINGLILLAGFFYLGEFLQKKLKIEKIVNEVSEKPFQNILISVIFSLIILYPICLYVQSSQIILKTFSISLYFFSILKIILNIKPLLKKIFFNNKIIFNENYLLFIFIFFGLGLLSFAPVTNADSLDYHLFVAKHLLEHGSFPTYLTNLHASYVSGPGEIMIALGLAIGSEQFGSILQYAGLISILGILKKYKAPYIFYIILFSSPVIIFFASSLKPQLFTICSSVFAFSLIFLNKFNKKSFLDNYETKKVILILIILFSSITIKFSFILSSFLLIVVLIVKNFSLKKKISILQIIIIFYSLIVLPSVLWKYINFGGNFFELFYSPFSTERYGLTYFKNYLTGLSESNVYWFVFPTSLGNFTHSLGLGTLMICYLFWVNNNLEKYCLLIIITIFILASYHFGQFTARFFLEPYMWISIYLLKFHKFIKIPKIYEFLLRIQAIIFFGVVLYGIVTLTSGVINSKLRDQVLEQNAMGYKFFKWVNFNLKNDNSPIIVFDRSISLSKNFVVSRDHLFFVNLSKPEAKEYVEEIKKIKPKYIVYSAQNTTYKKYINCTTKLYKSEEKVDIRAVRNPVNKSKEEFDAYIYEINTDLMPECINPNKVDGYARQ